MEGLVAEYLVTGRPAADGSVCPPDVVPFADATSRTEPPLDVPPGLPVW